jgi:hypothetical protein
MIGNRGRSVSGPGPGMPAFLLCGILNAAANDISSVAPQLRRDLLRIATYIGTVKR